MSHKSLLQFYGVAGFLRHSDRGVMMLIGYARVSTQDQTLRLQHDALTDGGCEKLFREKLSGTSTTLPAREKLLAFARKGDVVVVWKLDRLGRSLRDLIDVVNSLQDRGVGLRSLQEAIYWKCSIVCSRSYCADCGAIRCCGNASSCCSRFAAWGR